MVSESPSASSDMQDVGPVEVGRRLSEPRDQRLPVGSAGDASGMLPSSIACKHITSRIVPGRCKQIGESTVAATTVRML